MKIENKEYPPTMKAKGEQLDRLFKNLKQDWDFYKQTHDGRRRSTSSPDRKSQIPKSFNPLNLNLFDSSPRKLFFPLQENQSPNRWKVRNNDLTIEEIVRERKEAMESGGFKGKRLLEDLERVVELGLKKREEVFSVGSSALIQGSSTSSFSSSSDVGSVWNPWSLKTGEGVGVSGYEKKSGVIGIGNGDDDERKWMVKMGLLALVLVVFLLGVFCGRSLEGGKECQILIPTCR